MCIYPLPWVKSPSKALAVETENTGSTTDGQVLTFNFSFYPMNVASHPMSTALLGPVAVSTTL